MQINERNIFYFDDAGAVLSIFILGLILPNIFPPPSLTLNFRGFKGGGGKMFARFARGNISLCLTLS